MIAMRPAGFGRWRFSSACLTAYINGPRVRGETMKADRICPWFRGGCTMRASNNASVCVECSLMVYWRRAAFLVKVGSRVGWIELALPCAAARRPVLFPRPTVWSFYVWRTRFDSLTEFLVTHPFWVFHSLFSYFRNVSISIPNVYLSRIIFCFLRCWKLVNAGWR